MLLWDVLIVTSTLGNNGLGRKNTLQQVIKIVRDWRQFVGFSGYSGFLHQYNWNIVKSGVKHHNPNSLIFQKTFKKAAHKIYHMQFATGSNETRINRTMFCFYNMMLRYQISSPLRKWLTPTVVNDMFISKIVILCRKGAVDVQF